MRLSNISWSLFGLGVPLIVAALTVPALINAIGVDRFGLLALAWGLIGFAGVFDLGIGRATTLSIAQLRGASRLSEAHSVFREASRLALGAGLVGTVVLAAAVAAGVHRYIKYPLDVATEVQGAAFLLALTVPVQSVSAMYRGVNEAFESFREISFVRVGLGVTNFLGPYLVALHTTHLAALIASLLFSRLLALFLYHRFARGALESEAEPSTEVVATEVARGIRGQLLSFGGWFTVSCVVSPLLVQADRFFIGYLISSSAVAAYTIPFEVVTQLLIIVGAISSVAFPSLSRLMQSNPTEVDVVFRRWLMRVALIMLISTLLCAAVLPVVLPMWIGEQLPRESVAVGQILCIGIFANAIGSMYFARMHAAGRADITAKLHLAELPIFVLSLSWLISSFGVLGAAIAWSGRMIVDMALLWIVRGSGQRPAPESR
jgi:O-antigen/teichoic acid export membrane protein